MEYRKTVINLANYQHNIKNDRRYTARNLSMPTYYRKKTAISCTDRCPLKSASREA